VKHANGMKGFEGLGRVILGSNYPDFGHRVRRIDD
jgi:hypothetical protein